MDLRELEEELALLPKGYISKKTISGREYHYLQWKEAGKVKSRYIKAGEVEEYRVKIARRKELEYIIEHQMPGTTDGAILVYAQGLRLGYTLGIGCQDFEDMVKRQVFYVDKTGFIRAWWEQNDEVTLIARPRRFGKTLNMSMVNCFFSNRYAGRADLFEPFEIWSDVDMRELQGQFPVIFLSFGGVKMNTAEGLITQMKQEICRVYLEYADILDPALLQEVTPEMDDARALNAVPKLCEVLYHIYGRKVIVLLDEYDTPALEAFGAGIYEDCINFMRTLFNGMFKTNPYLERGLLTGIMRISKESFFSDLNNVSIYDMTKSKYSSYFGFREEEVFAAMDAQGMGSDETKTQVKRWYDGFHIGEQTDIYNPWSIVNFLREREYRPYWVNSSSNDLICDLLQAGSREIKEKFEILLAGKAIDAELTHYMNFRNIMDHEDALWNLLFYSGYLKIVGHNADGHVKLVPTNYEVMELFRSMPRQWLKKDMNHYNVFVEALLEHDLEYMNDALAGFCQKVFSYYDVTGQEPERFYHGFVLGLMVDLGNRYEVTSNRESGLGRYDVMIVPKDEEREKGRNAAYILEFKVKRKSEASLEVACEKALQQIEEKGYRESLLAIGFADENIYCYGIAFEGKKVLILSR